MARLRVMLAIGGMHGGGSERQLVLLLKHLDRNRFEPHLYLVYRTGPLLDQIPGDVRVHSFDQRVTPSRLYLPGLMHSRRVRDYARCLQENQIDVSYDRTFLMTLITAAGAQKVGVPNVSTVVTNPEIGFAPVAGRFQWFKRRMLHRLYNRSFRVLAVSNGARESAIRFYGIQPDRIVTHYNGVDFEAIDQAAQVPVNDEWWTQSLDQTGRPVFRIVSAGRLNHEKGFHVLIQAVRDLCHRMPQVAFRLALLGDGPHRDSLQIMINQMGLQNQMGQQDVVRLVGFQSNAPAWYRSANVFVLASLMEGMPNVLLEAMACGTPVVSTDCQSGPAEILQGDEYGTLVPVNDALAISRAVESIVLQPESARTTALAAQKFARTRWSIQSAVRNLEQHLEEAAASRKRQ
ncbi:MAG: glycosyltransferase [Planctomycetaceae bacterium]